MNKYVTLLILVAVLCSMGLVLFFHAHGGLTTAMGQKPAPVAGVAPASPVPAAPGEIVNQNKSYVKVEPTPAEQGAIPTASRQAPLPSVIPPRTPAAPPASRSSTPPAVQPQPEGVSPAPSQPAGPSAPQPEGISPAPSLPVASPAPQPERASPAPSPPAASPAPQAERVSPAPPQPAASPASQPERVSPAPPQPAASPAPQPERASPAQRDRAAAPANVPGGTRAVAGGERTPGAADASPARNATAAGGGAGASAAPRDAGTPPAAEQAADAGSLSQTAAHVLKGIELRVTGQKAQLRIEAEDSFPCKAFVLSNPPRLVVDLPGTWQQMRAPSVPANRVVRGVRIGIQERGPRLVLDMEKAPNYEIARPAEGVVEISIQ